MYSCITCDAIRGKLKAGVEGNPSEFGTACHLYASYVNDPLLRHWLKFVFVFCREPFAAMGCGQSLQAGKLLGDQLANCESEVKVVI